MVSCKAFKPSKNILKELSFRIENSQKKLDYSGITFPVTIKKIDQVERQNQINTNVFGYNTKSVFPIRISRENYDDHMELLYIEGEEDSRLKQHYVYQSFQQINVFIYRKKE